MGIMISATYCDEFATVMYCINIIECNYSTIIINYSYFVHLLSFFAETFISLYIVSK